MCHDNEEWCKIWRGIHLSFKNWREKFEESSFKLSKVSKICTLMGYFWIKYMVELKKYRGVMFRDTEKSWALVDLVFLEKFVFDMLKSIWFGDLARPFSSLTRSDRVYLGWFVWDSVRRLFQMQALNQSVKGHYGFSSIGSSLSTGFHVYLSKCWDPYVSPGCTVQLNFFWGFSSLFHHVNIVTRAGFQVYFS